MEMNPLQIVAITLGAVLVIYSVKDDAMGFLGGIKSMFSSKKSVVAKKETLTTLVRKWDALSDALKASGLEEAHSKLQEVFPKLIKVEENE